MNLTKMLKTLVLAAALPLTYLADFSPDARFGFTLLREALAIIGAPMTPMSVAGVARRTTVVAATAMTATAITAEKTAAASQQQAAMAQQQQAVAQQQAATAQQQAATAQQQAAAAQKPPAPAGAPVAAGMPAVGTIVTALPSGCAQEAKGGVEYQKCGNVYYRAAFQGNTLVYVVQQP